MTVAPNYLVDGLVTSVRNKYIQPNSQNLFTDDDVASLLDEEMRSDVLPLILKANEDYWTAYFDQPVTGASSYTIPRRAVGGTLRDIVFVDPQGNEIEVTRLSPAQIKATFPGGYQLPLYTFGFFLKDDRVLPYPQQAQNATGYTLRMKIFRRPNNLTLSKNCGQITAINGSVITLSSMDSAWTTASLFDIIENYSLFVSVSDDQAISAINTATNQITLTSVPTGLAVGMWVCPQYMTCVPQIPYEAWSLLVQRGAISIATSLGDSQGLDLLKKGYTDMVTSFMGMISPRVKGTPKKVVNRNNQGQWGSMGTPFLR